MVGFRGLAVDESSTIYQNIQQLGIGGVVLFDVDVPTNTKNRNIRSPEQLANLTAHLHSISTIPLIIAIDQEGGQVARLKPEYGFPETVSHEWLGEQNCLSMVRSTTKQMAATLAQNGINLNFAPCVDLKLDPRNPVIAAKARSFSHDPAIVTSLAIEFIKAHHEHGVLCTLKHFPGHGSSTSDSHLGFVDVTHTWWPDELQPYQKLIKLGLADAVMTAHVFNARLDDQFPATLSERVITGTLRRQLGFDGLVFTDDMQMRAITCQFGLETAVAFAVNAGVDILLFGNNCDYDEQIAETVIDLIVKHVESGTIAESRIDESIERIATFKSKLKAVHG